MTSIANLHIAPGSTPKQDELRRHFAQFVGEAFYGQMIKAMHSTLGRPAYFHGGRAEEVFQGQLNQQLAEHLASASADRLAAPMFERQFPRLATRASQSQQPATLDELRNLRRV